MDRVKIKKMEQGDLVGCWEWAEGFEKPIVYCPNCGGGLLGGFSAHRFEENGDINNSVVCPCGFHEYISLLDYEPQKN